MEVSSSASRLRLPEYGRFSHAATKNGGTDRLSPLSRRRETVSGSVSPCAAEMSDATSAAAFPGMSNNSRVGHIRVAVRVRPLPAGEDGIIEVAGEGAIAIRKEAATGGNQFLSTQQGRVEERMFDRVYGPWATQEEVYAWTSAPLIEEAMAAGRNATVFVYGATGAGKTHTMFGGEREEQQGIIFRAVREIFSHIQVQRSQCAGDEWYDSGDSIDEAGSWLDVKVSFLELYNETVRDLLQENSSHVACRVLEDERRGVVQVSNLLEIPVQSADEALRLLNAGMEARTVEATAANAQSSRAHAVFALSVDRVRRRPEGRGFFKRHSPEVRQPHCKISLIDLAGSERAKDTQNCGAALKDGARINQSLLALANCIDALTARTRETTSTQALRKKPPYRDSKLTLMLKGSLTGDGLVSMVANVHPGRTHFEDSNNTLEYAKRASVVKPMRRQQRRSVAAAMGPPHEALAAARGSRRSLPAQDAPADDDETGMLASSSTLPPPTPTPPSERARQRKITCPASDAVWPAPCAGGSGSGSAGESAESTASRSSSPAAEHFPQEQEEDLEAKDAGAALGGAATTETPEECLSELSLPSDAAVEDSEESCRAAWNNSSSAEQAWSTYAELEDVVKGGVVHEPGVDKSEAEPDGQADSLAQPAPNVLSPLAVQILDTLQAEKVDLNSRIHTVLLERDALLQERGRLLQDRSQLEKENENLRAVNIEKDRQISLLLAGVVNSSAA
mmetsp:Transcript_13418/g.23602  ORF Transcript_13418/g.23602 Transcript_13418/m.23602 type:complete len:736 (+) Transcript_13418:106-2313(+)